MFVDCRVSKLDNCYPMIPAGAAHTEMLFGPEDAPVDGGEEASILV